MDSMIPVIMAAWVVFALWLARDGWRHARGDHPAASRAHGALLATSRFAAAAGLLVVVAGTVYGADLLWLALAPPVVILAAGLAAHVGTRWLVRRPDPAAGTLRNDP